VPGHKDDPRILSRFPPFVVQRLQCAREFVTPADEQG
jgi:hypothetical protein